MDRLIRRFDSEKSDDLMFCAHRGIAYQRNMGKGKIRYDAAYLAHYDQYAAGPIADALNAGRVALLSRHAESGASVLDVGAAAGQFVRAACSWGFAAKGFDVIPEACDRLRAAGLFADDPDDFDVVTCWDSLEHMEDPESTLGRVRRGALLLVAVPIMEDIRQVRASKHFKPGEHFYYWTAQGFIDWMRLYGFRLLEQSTHETDAGRESIGAFAFCRDLPDYRDYIAAYQELHAGRHYGSSATELHLATVAKVVTALQPGAILDYGCGRSDLVAHFWLDGGRRIERYDPAIPAWKRMPKGLFDLVLACDVMEHIPMAAVDKVLGEIRDKAPLAIFTISIKLARAKLPDGSNAHCTLLTHAEWARWIREYFGHVETLRSTSEHELVLFAGKAPLNMRRAA